MLVLPIVLVVLSLARTLSTFGATPPLIFAWALALVLVGFSVGQRPAPPGSAWDAGNGRFPMPGSWQPLGLMLALYLLKFKMVVNLALDAMLADQAGLAMTVSALYGALSGVFVGRARRRWRLRARPPADPPLPPAAGWRGIAGLALAAVASLLALLAAMIA